jgi:hypothetical protein
MTARDLTVFTVSGANPPSSATTTTALAPAAGDAASDARASTARIDDRVRMLSSSPLPPWLAGGFDVD